MKDENAKAEAAAERNHIIEICKVVNFKPIKEITHIVTYLGCNINSPSDFN